MDKFFSKVTELTPTQLAELRSILSKGLCSFNRDRINTMHLRHLKATGSRLADRFYIANDSSVRYCAGQCYTTEIATIRKLILKGWE
jgi:hypothetical protein